MCEFKVIFHIGSAGASRVAILGALLFGSRSSAKVQVKLESLTVNHYRLLSISRDASDAEIKAAYHRALLIFHPDKRLLPTAYPSSVDITSIKDAYTILSSRHLRAQYDAQLRDQSTSRGPRPAQVISLEEFDEQESMPDSVSWSHECRCGGAYGINEDDLERGQHIVGCSNCSEVVWVGYELAKNEE